MLSTLERYRQVSDIVKDVSAPGYEFQVDLHTDLVYIRVVYVENDIFKGVPETQLGRRWIIEDDATDAAIIQTCFKAYQTSLEHRARESFTYQGMALLHPHHNLDDLMATAQVRQHGVDEIKFSEDIR